MAEFPISIASLSRFCTAKQTREVLDGLADGRIDIVIGTHRLAQHDVTFKNLGLVIIDEEQRFGVEVKERLKALRHTVDVLTMTATPIPRTLHLSLLGVRDISNLETPPNDRLAIETRVTRFDAQLVRHAVMRELNRGGQIFFVHNRVHDIQKVAQRLQQIVPEARIAIGHGQMPENELEQVMLDFVDHSFDLLLATTIVESGLDIPNANTIFIDEADRYGLADLHQLRGRVGRYKHRAYCYLLVDPHKHLSTTAARRLRAIEEFSQMGSGFAIAMRDLELRGAGNILGTQQSGHIATVGYELYCELLEQAVRKLKQLPPKVHGRRQRRSAMRGLHPAQLRAGHASEDRLLSPRGPAGHDRRVGRPGRRVGRSVWPPAAGGRANAAAGSAAHLGTRLANRVDPRRGRVRRAPLSEAAANRAVGGEVGLAAANRRRPQRVFAARAGCYGRRRHRGRRRSAVAARLGCSYNPAPPTPG